MSSIDAVVEARNFGTGAAPGQYLGYGLQDVRLCMRLLMAGKGDVVSTEYLDDVAVRMANGRYLLEQCKSALSTKNPVSDWSVDLWKTFTNWLETTNSLGLNPAKTDYILYVNPARTGRFVSALHEARSDGEVRELIAELRMELSSRKLAPACASYLQMFLEADPALRTPMVRNFMLIAVPGDPVDEIRQHFDTAVSPAVIEVICSAAIGYAKILAANRIRAGGIAEIDAADFRAKSAPSSGGTIAMKFCRALRRVLTPPRWIAR